MFVINANMDNKVETKKAYELYANKFDIKFEQHFLDFVRMEADIFIQNLNGIRILDLGSGPGNHAKYFKEKGLDILCLDYSFPMARLCKAKGLSSLVMDIESLGFKERIFDGIWAYASLLHLLKKDLPKAIESIEKILKTRGLLAIALKEGEGEKLEINEKYPGTKRLFSYFIDGEVRSLFGGSFDFIYSSRDNVRNKYVFLNYLLRLKS